MRRFGKLILSLVILMLLIGSCKKDDDPGVAVRNDYLGLWQCDEYDVNQFLLGTFQIEIIAHPTAADKVLMDNFARFGLGFQTEAILDNTAIVIPAQLVSATTISGSGFITNNLLGLELQYVLDDGSGQPENITATCNKL
ncbi:MAG: hypothetical protein JKX74_08435 [Flavobacteriales bacterium]|nr:hypothetical protein [Flavobacteriales bacterium]